MITNNFQHLQVLSLIKTMNLILLTAPSQTINQPINQSIKQTNKHTNKQTNKQTNKINPDAILKVQFTSQINQQIFHVP